MVKHPRIRAISLALALVLLNGVPSARAAYPEAEMRSVESEKEREIRSLREQEVNQLKIALGRRIEKNRRSDLYLRIAEIYFEAYRMEFLIEGKVHEQRLARADGKKISSIDRGRSRAYLAKGIEACKDILRLGLATERLDKIYYFLAFNYGELGNRKQSLHYYEEMTRRFPRSPLVFEAYLAIGEAAYGERAYRKAINAFESAIRVGGGDLTPRVYHEKAWAHFRLKQYPAAVESMKSAVEGASGSSEKFVSLREEALRDLALFMTESGQVDEAISYFKRVAGDQDYYAKALEKLGKQYERNVEPEKAAKVYETLMRTQPEDEAAFRVRVKLIDLDLRRGRYADALVRVKAGEIPRSGEPDTVVAAQNLKAMVRRTATEQHESFRKKGTKTALSTSESFYEAYLAQFLRQEDPRLETPEIQMYLAEIKRELAKPKEASALYKLVVRSQDKRYTKEAAALWAQSLFDAIKKGEGASNSSAAKPNPSPLELEFVEAADDLQETLKDLPEGREAALRAAQVLAGYAGSRKQSVQRARALIEKWPRSAQAVSAARLWLQVYGDLLPKDSAKLEDSEYASDVKTAIEVIQGNPTLLATDVQSGGKLGQAIAYYEERFKVGQIASLEDRKDYRAAAEAYEKYAVEANSRELAEKAFVSAMAAFSRVGEDRSVERVAAKWKKKYPGSKLYPSSFRAAATHAFILGNAESAGRLFERLAMDTKDADPLWTAARIYDGSGNIGKAREVWGRYIQLYPKNELAMRANLSLAQSYEQEGKGTQAEIYYKACVGQSPTEAQAECVTLLARLYARDGKKDLAAGLYQQGAKFKDKGAASPWIGQLRYWAAEQLLTDSRLPALALPEASLNAAIQERLAFLEKYKKAHELTLETASPWAVDSLARLGLFVEEFAEQLATVSAQTSGEVKKTLDGIVISLQKRSVEFYKQGFQRAQTQVVLSDSLRKIGDRLADLGLANRAQGPAFVPRVMGVPLQGGNEGRSAQLEQVRNRLQSHPKEASNWIDYGNLLWGQGRPGLAKIAYDFAAVLDPKSPASANNRAALLLAQSESASEVNMAWYTVNEALGLWAPTHKNSAVLFNRSSLLNYYRLFAAAQEAWMSLPAAGYEPERTNGIGIAKTGLGESSVTLKPATANGGNNFAAIYWEAASLGQQKKYEACSAKIEDIDTDGLKKLEREAYDHLKNHCANQGKKPSNT